MSGGGGRARVEEREDGVGDWRHLVGRGCYCLVIIVKCIVAID